MTGLELEEEDVAEEVEGVGKEEDELSDDVFVGVAVEVVAVAAGLSEVAVTGFEEAEVAGVEEVEVAVVGVGEPGVGGAFAGGLCAQNGNAKGTCFASKGRKGKFPRTQRSSPRCPRHTTARTLSVFAVSPFLGGGQGASAS